MTVRAPQPTRALHGHTFEDAAAPLAVGAVAAVLAFTASVATPSAKASVAVGLVALTFVTVWMATSRNLPLTLAALMLWLGLFDGFVRLKSGVHAVTLLRDVLLYAIVVGWLVRAGSRSSAVRLPPLSGWVLAFVAVVFVQLFNPANASLGHALAAIRPHVEWVPLFFLGYLVMRTRRRLRIFLMLLLVITAINGAVATYQSGLSPDALAAWGPGYAERVFGTGDVSGRVGFASNPVETPFVRPFALGSDINFGGTFGVLALSAAMALFALSKDRRSQLVVGALAGGVVVAVATSQARSSVLAAVVAAVAFLALATVLGRTARALRALVPFVALALLIGPLVASLSGFNRYESITPNRVLATTYDYRKESFSKLPTYIADFPLGAGLGSVGPAKILEPRDNEDLDAENELNFLVIELGVPGLLILTLFTVRVLGLAATGLRKVRDSELRLLLAAVAAPLFALLVGWIAGVATATSPGSPYFWFATGTLAYWLARRDPARQVVRGSSASASRSSRTTTPVGA
jgi:hypothetical protein